MFSEGGLTGLMLWFALMKSGLMLEFRALEVNAGSLPLVHVPGVVAPTKMQYHGILILGERHDTWHADEMYRQIVKVKGIPEENVIQIGEFPEISYYTDGTNGNMGVDWLLSSGSSTLTDMLSRTFPNLRSQVRVVSIPYFPVFGNSPHQIPLVDASNVLFVIPTGNTYLLPDVFGVAENPRDLWHSDHPFWDMYATLMTHAYYMDLLRTDNVIFASSHGFRWEEDASGGLTLTVFPGQHNIKCGATKDNCFSLAVSVYPRTRHDDYLRYHGGSYTSAATAHLSAIAFYLAQFFPTAEEIVSTLRTCAIDVGEPGPDREYGVGVVNLFCPEVFQKEAEVYVGSLKSTGKSSPVLQELTHRSPAGLSFRSAVGFCFQGVQGYAGVSYTTSALQATVLAGFSDAPFGVVSRLHQQRTTFFEVGLRKPLIPHLSLVVTPSPVHSAFLVTRPLVLRKYPFLVVSGRLDFLSHSPCNQAPCSNLANRASHHKKSRAFIPSAL